MKALLFFPSVAERIFMFPENPRTRFFSLIALSREGNFFLRISRICGCWKEIAKIRKTWDVRRFFDCWWMLWNMWKSSKARYWTKTENWSIESIFFELISVTVYFLYFRTISRLLDDFLDWFISFRWNFIQNRKFGVNLPRENIFSKNIFREPLSWAASKF